VETVADFASLGLKRPNATRWNSVYMAVERLVRLIKEKGEDEFNTMCFTINRTRFTVGEIQFLNEYVSVMKNVAQALNILQSENRMFMGYLLPTVFMLKDKLTSIFTTSLCCKPLVQAILNGIDARFQCFFEDDEVVAAALLIPKFKTSWTKNREVIDRGINYIRHKLANATGTSSSPPGSIPGTDSDDDEDSFFADNSKSTADVEVFTQYLHQSSTEIKSLHAYPRLRDLFVMLNTPLPASAAVERLFSSAALVMTKRRNRMSDKLFETLVFLKANKNKF